MVEKENFDALIKELGCKNPLEFGTCFPWQTSNPKMANSTKKRSAPDTLKNGAIPMKPFENYRIHCIKYCRHLSTKRGVEVQQHKENRNCNY